MEYALRFEELHKSTELYEGQAIKLFIENANMYLRMELERTQHSVHINLLRH